MYFLLIQGSLVPLSLGKPQGYGNLYESLSKLPGTLRMLQIKSLFEMGYTRLLLFLHSRVEEEIWEGALLRNAGVLLVLFTSPCSPEIMMTIG